MRTFVARSGRSLCLIVAVACGLPLASVWAEGEAATGSADSENNVGLGVFTRFPLKISLEVRGGYDDNVNTTHFSPQDSWFVNAGAVVSYELQTPRTTLSLSSTLGFTYYDNTGSNLSNAYEPNINFTLAITHKASPRLTLAFNGVAVYQTEPDFQYGFGTNRRAGNYFYTSDKISASYLWAPRFATVTSYSLLAVRYDDIASGLFEDRVENTIGNEFRFLLLPTTNLVGEYRFQIVNYEHVNRDSTAHFILAGVDHVFSPRLNATFRGGAEFRDYDDIGEKDSPYFEAVVSYKLAKETAISWLTNYGIEEGDIATNPTRQTFRTGLQGKHNLTPRITASLSLFYQHDDYPSEQAPNPFGGPPLTSPSFAEDTFNVDLALRYNVTRYFGIEAGYDHTEVSSDIVLREYSRNRIWAGLNVAF